MDIRHAILTSLYFHVVFDVRVLDLNLSTDELNLDFANAFLSPGLNSRAELVPSPWAYVRPERRLTWGQKIYQKKHYYRIETISTRRCKRSHKSY
jgi:hypothetical protein